MLESLKPVLYVRISPERIVVTNVKSGESLSELAEVAMAGNKALAVGSEARSALGPEGARLVKPFAHPRTIVSDFTSGEQLLKALMSKIVRKSWFAASPKVVMHPLGNPEGGLTAIERRALQEMGLGAGAAEAVVWTGRELSNEEVLRVDFSAGEGAQGG